MDLTMKNQTAVFNNQNMICFDVPTTMSSRGVFNDYDSLENGYLSYPLPLLELQIGLIFVVSHIFHFFLKRFGITFFVSCLITGIILGPTVLGRYEFMKEKVFFPGSQDLLGVVIIICLHLFLFLSAVKMDVAIVLKSGKKALTIGTLIVLVPFFVGLCFIHIIKVYKLGNEEELKELFFVIQTQSLTLFPVIAYLLGQLRITNTELGRLGLSSALVADIIGMVTKITTTFMRDSKNGFNRRDLICILIFLLVALLVFRPIMRWIVNNTPSGMPVDSTYIGIIVPLVFLSGFYFHTIHQGGFLGPIILGFTVPAGPPLGSALIDKFEAMTFGILLPIHYATAMMRVDFLVILPELATLKYFIAAVIVIFVVKLAVSLISGLFFNIRLVDAIAFACIMSTKGVLELTTYVALKDTERIRDEIFAIGALCILLNSTIIPIVVKFFYDPLGRNSGYQARNIASLKPESELRILSCIHRNDNIASAIRMLKIIYPTKESPLRVYVLRLIELIGKATPTFLTHTKDKPVSTSDPCSQNVIISFDHYEQSNQNSVSVHNFTAISPAVLMSDDICTLALKKLTSLILVPLHRKWSIHGVVESDDRLIRAVTRGVLEKSPCSVGIFFDRMKHNYNYSPAKTPERMFVSLCMIYLGGNDDREALTLAKRMARNAFASLTIIHIVSDNEETNTNAFDFDERVLNARVLDDVKKCGLGNELSVVYTMYPVKDGAGTALLVNSLVNDFDLFIVGRRYGIECKQTVGLSQWSEIPELGIIGDLLASKDLNSEASVLVVQQQKHIRRLH